MADNLAGWHDPKKVNVYMSSIVDRTDFYSNDDVEQLCILWQLRHSVVHTGGWMTQPDAQKVKTLGKLAGKPILLNHNFVRAAAQRFHKIVKRSTDRVGKKFIAKLPTGIAKTDKDAVEALFKVSSPRRGWL